VFKSLVIFESGAGSHCAYDVRDVQ
jgi:hypothetical protein